MLFPIMLLAVTRFTGMLFASVPFMDVLFTGVLFSSQVCPFQASPSQARPQSSASRKRSTAIRDGRRAFRAQPQYFSSNAICAECAVSSACGAIRR